MAKIVSIHSYRGGTGKSNLTANLAVCMAASGKRVAVVDTDIQSPGIHMLFGVEDGDGLKTSTTICGNAAGSSRRRAMSRRRRSRRPDASGSCRPA